MNSSTKFALISRILNELDISDIDPKKTINFDLDGKFHRYYVSNDPATHARGWFVANANQNLNIAFGNINTGLNINISIPVLDKMQPEDWFGAYKNQLSATTQRQKFSFNKNRTLHNVDNYWFHVIVLKHTSLEMEIQYV